MVFDPITEMYDKSGELLGVQLSAEAWLKVRETVLAALGPRPEEERPEPLADWELLKQYWDFPYPVDMDVACSECGAGTEDWSKDEPRKFRLTGANLGGLVAFRCQGCRAKVVKKHFKSHIKTEVTPFQDKIPTKEARYK
ncbi:MAG TPA: hypothetical protein PKB11_11220 [Desulfovibrio sp.]|uniref:hypothetical protein n=1 Tax=Desulfovibrio TaxID=872 RepID=UPI0004185EE6|nr:MULTISPECIES: hypothetical protein [Desulfovibrio]HMM39316.1 hypothetical protein [Desulfovibrio sp.]